jgi:signal peptidase I
VSKKARKGIFSETYGYIKALFWAILIAFVIKTSIAEAYLVPSSSMEDTLLVGDFVISTKFVYGAKIPFVGWRLPGIREPRPGDIITFKFPGDLRTDFVKRCVAVEGQIVTVKDKVLYIDGEQFPDPEFAKHTDERILDDPRVPRDNFGPYRVPRGTIFAMGDNRDNSNDSRFWGPVPIDLIEGKVMFIQWSIATDKNALAIDVADLSTIPAAVVHNLIHFWDRIRWDRFLRGVD